MRGHVVAAFVIVAIADPRAEGVQRSAAVLRYNRIHPGLEVMQHPWVGVLVDCEACTGVQAGQMQHSLPQFLAGNPGVQHFVEPCETPPWGADLQLLQNLMQGHGPGFVRALQFWCQATVPT
ncbi:MAG: Uncharacterised protein [Synechococcus sp. CC9902]|nr:MAG: Uncharacterised protein [Synechococcus sp. CC9902]